MIPLRRSSGDQYLHRKSECYRKAVNRKIDAYYRHIQIGIIAQGLLQYLSSVLPKLVWSSFGSWIRTIRPGMCPSEQITSIAMRNSFPEFFANSSPIPILKKFLYHRIDLTRSEGLRRLLKTMGRKKRYSLVMILQLKVGLFKQFFTPSLGQQQTFDTF